MDIWPGSHVQHVKPKQQTDKCKEKERGPYKDLFFAFPVAVQSLENLRCLIKLRFRNFVFRHSMLSVIYKANKRTFVRFQVLRAASTKMGVFWDVAPCSVVEFYKRFRDACCLDHQDDQESSPWWCRQQAPLKRRYPSTGLHGATSQKTSSYSPPWEPEISHSSNLCFWARNVAYIMEMFK
jgi:hypothetical protein